MTARSLPQPLAFVAFFAHGMSILENRGLVKSRLEHLPSSLLGSKVASTSILMAVTEDSWLLCFRHTPSDYLVGIVFVQEWFLLIIGMNFCKEEFLSCAFHPAGSSPITKNLQCEHTKVPPQPGAVTSQGTHH